ncbi:MAG: CARDB domain-containing protein, partial [Candidatus Methanofastidiosia archaeon]
MNKSLVVLGLILSLVISNSWFGDSNKWAKAENQEEFALILLETNEINVMKDAINFIQSKDGRIIHVFPTHILIGEIPLFLDGEIIGKKSIIKIYREVVDPSLFEDYGRAAIFGATSWNNNIMGLEETGLVQGFQDPGPIENDVRKVPYAEAAEESLAAAYGAGYWDTSEFMIGSIAVGIILMESNGSAENWSTSRENQVISEIQNAMNWWNARESDAHLSFVYDIQTGVPTSVEPIQTSSTNDDTWINHAMDYFGIASDYYLTRVRTYNNDLRDTYGTDWAITIFVVDSLNDADGEFTDGAFAYAYFAGPNLSSGPCIIMTYDNDGYTITYMDAVAAHEFGHGFYAMDQYASSGCTCTESSGYHNTPNQNCENSCSSDVGSIMRGGISGYLNGQVDTYARQQIGWKDTDGDGILDILDFEPNTTLAEHLPDPTTDDTPTYTGTASTTQTLNNQNPMGQGNDITVNKIVSVQYRLREGTNPFSGWIDATPTDGAFDEVQEDYTFVTSSLPPGTYTFQVRAQNTSTNWETSYPEDVLTILPSTPMPDLTLSSSDISFNPSSPTEGDIVQITATINNQGTQDAGSFDVRFYLDSVGGTQIGTDQNISGIVASGTGQAQVNWDTTGLSGSHDIYVVADVLDSVAESNEGNNEAYNTVDIGSLETIIDNTDPGFSVTGTWGTSSWSSQRYGSNYRYHPAGTGSETATWSTTLNGTYEVFSWWNSIPSRAQDATYTINHSGGSTSVVVDQRYNGGQWNSLGVFTFSGTASVVLTDSFTGKDVVADAVRFVPPGTSETIIDNTDPGFSVTGTWGT